MCPGEQKIFYYSGMLMKKLVRILKRAEVDISTNSVFVGHGHQQFTAAGSREGQEQQYYTYVIPKGTDLKDAIVLHVLHCLDAMAS